MAATRRKWSMGLTVEDEDWIARIKAAFAVLFPKRQPLDDAKAVRQALEVGAWHFENMVKDRLRQAATVHNGEGGG